jgi:hypothetical protein
VRFSRALGPWLPLLLFSAAVLSGFVAFVLIGREADSRGARVLGALAPAFDGAKAGGLKSLEWLWSHPRTIGMAVTGAAVMLGVLGMLAARLRASPFLLVLAGLSLATWGQLSLWQKGATPAGVGLYLGGVFCAGVLGRLYPMARLPGFPALPSPAGPPPQSRDRKQGLPWSEWALVLGLTLLGLLFRGYALNEHPALFDGEMTGVMVGSYTGYGISAYMRTEFLGTGAGLFHVVTHNILYRLFGASIFTIRSAALFWGVVAIPLLYWLARRIAGRAAAIAATVLFIAAPEQLFWSRTENTHFAPVAVLALVTAHLGLWMQERFAPRAVLAAALWMPFSRYSYTPSFVLFTLPLILAAHAAVFVHGVFRRLRYVAPILLGGLLLWILSLSVVEFALEPGRGWHFIHPAQVKGEAAWRHNIRQDAGPFEVLREQGVRVLRNAGQVAAGMTYHSDYATHWYTRYFVGHGRNTTISAGLAVLAALGVGYLLGQPQGRRAALLLLWIVIGLLPGCMSDEPEARRISIVFPALPIVAGVFFAASIRLARQAAGLSAARMTTAALGVAVAVTAFTSFASNLLLTTAPLHLEAVKRFAKPLFEHSDLLFHNLVGGEDDVFRIASLDTLVGGRPARCSQFAQEKDWPGAALFPRCDFTDSVFRLTLSERERELRLRNYRPTRIGYLLRETRESLVHIDLLRRLFPTAETREFPAPVPEERLFAMEISLSDIELLRKPEVSAENMETAGRARTGLLEGVELAVASQTTPGTMIRGGLFLPETGWYRFELEPPCPSAQLTAGNPASGSPEARPLLSGVHPFAIRLPKAVGCQLPLKLRIESGRAPGKTISPLFVAPRVVSAAQADPVVSSPGYGQPRIIARLTDHPVDMGVDGEGRLFVLALGPAGWRVHRFAPEGREEAVFRAELPRSDYAALSVDAKGNCVLSSFFSVEIRDRSGKLLQSWKVPYDRPPSDVAFLPDGRMLFCLPNADSVGILSRDGRSEGSLASAGGRLSAPTGVAVAADGTIVVVEAAGFVHVFRTPVGRWAPVHLGTFEVAYPEIPYIPDLAACAFDGTDNVLFPHRLLSAPLVYDLKGRPVLASTPERDLSSKDLANAHSVCATRDALYVLESSPPSIIRIARP